jgi:hypothetical protein
MPWITASTTICSMGMGLGSWRVSGGRANLLIKPEIGVLYPIDPGRQTVV